MSTIPQRPGPPAPEWNRAPDHVAYHTCRENICGLLDRHPGAAGVTVPACPDLTVRDLLAHLVEVCWDVHGRMTGAPQGAPEAPTEVILAEMSLAELLAGWTSIGDRIERLMAGGKPGANAILAMDVFCHELDVRQAFGEPAPADHPSYPGALDLVVRGFGGAVGAHGLPALQIETSGAQWVAGSGEPEATVYGERHDLFRSLTGRRTLAQIGELSWTGPAEQWSPAFTWGPFRPPVKPSESATAS
jgi:uncharacterized protein (TIGR03083 family)